MKMKSKSKPKKFAEGGITDEERYGKVGAEIRRLDPEAYKNRPGTVEGNLKLLKELRAKANESSEPVNARAEAVFRGLKGKSESSTPKFSAARPYATAKEAAATAARRGIEDKPIEQVAPETWGLGGALKGAAALGTAALGGRALLKAGLANEARAAARMGGEAEKMEMLRKSRVLNAQKAGKAQAKAEADAAAREEAERHYRLKDIAAEKEANAAKQRLLDENEYTTQFAMKRGGKVKRYASGGSVSTASKRGDGCATKGKTKGRFI